MTRILIYNHDENESVKIKNNVKQVLTSRCISNEIYELKSSSKIEEVIAKNPMYFNVLILDGYEPITNKKICRTLRSNNLKSAIFLMGGYENINDINSYLRHRPSGIYCSSNGGDLFDRTLIYSIKEQKINDGQLVVKTKDGMLRIPYENITHLVSDKRIINVYVNSGNCFAFYGKLTDIYELLPHSTFIHCHQSYIVNMEKITALDKANKCFIVNNKTNIYISKSKYSVVVNFFEQFISDGEYTVPNVT